jgi:putative transposase
MLGIVQESGMAHTCVSGLYHCVFSTKDRRKTISPELQSPLWAYLGGIARSNGMTAIAVGGVDDHVHVLLSLPAVMPLAKAVQLLKGGSSKWVHDNHTGDFAWQSGYGAFTVSISQVDTTVAYIRNQAEHHRKRDYQAEFVAFLKKHKIEYDPRYIWG